MFVYKGRDYSYEGQEYRATTGRKYGMLKGKDFYVVGVATDRLGLEATFSILTWIERWVNPNAPPELEPEQFPQPQNNTQELSE